MFWHKTLTLTGSLPLREGTLSTVTRLQIPQLIDNDTSDPMAGGSRSPVTNLERSLQVQYSRSIKLPESQSVSIPVCILPLMLCLKPSAEKLAMVASTVSSKMVEAMAAKEGFKFAECLTGEFNVEVPAHLD